MRVAARVDLDAISHNISVVREKVGKEVKVMAVIKANAYGHGAVQIARSLCEDNLVYGFAVATASEGFELRNSGITAPILVLGYSFSEQYKKLVKNKITQTVFDIESARRLSDTAVALGSKAVVHIKVDTGMGRIGLSPDEKGIETVKEIASLPGLEIQGIFTHFACADEVDKTFTEIQYERYISFVKRLEEIGINIPIKHVANSASIIEFNDKNLSMVRSGIMTYGLYPSEFVNTNELELRPALSLNSHVTFVKTINKGDSVSYGATFKADSTRKIATVPVGYGDGYPRSLSNKGYVLINGKKAPIVGRVCMDQFMVDVTDIEDVHTGTLVVLIGKSGDLKISVEEIAALAGTFNYEFVCDINTRVPRVFVKNNELYDTIDYLVE